MLVTGHTGFKGGWLSLWLQRQGARVHGYALDPTPASVFFESARLSSHLTSDTRADILDLERLRRVVRDVRPVALFHLAAQPLVLEGYAAPLETFEVNVIGTANVLEAARESETLRAVVVVTTDKVYENREWLYPYRENDPVGGYDPYSASKAAAEIVSASYRSSFFGGAAHPAWIATARAGNVIGGGDWAANRLIPDCLRAFEGNRPVQLRYPEAVRPWQHVLEPVSGYISLAERLLEQDGGTFARAWNFGPDANADATVGEVARLVCQMLGDESRLELPAERAQLHEAGMLRLDSTLARTQLGWSPRWSLEEAVGRTVAWRRASIGNADMRAFSASQIDDYCKMAVR